ncbi:MAG TPA: transferrin receptor-like dimerization domain-containing protein [Candidatus Dormibacteraeota bacterium]|nr:transferrin receptor-like dimerization domain-containing protein [Candidatus Dormibacteraeota bacterium]
MKLSSRTVFGFALLFLLAPLAADEPPLAGYSAESARIERQWENKFRAIPDPDTMRAYMEKLSSRPHHVGSPFDKENAEWIAAKFQAWGLDTRIENFDVLFPTPRERLVELVEGGPRFVAKLDEPVLSQDPTSNQKAEQLPSYHAYSADGDVTGPLVYVNFGIPEDYEQLERLGISVKGAIVITRYGQSWRGIKPKVAAEHGAVGCLVYSDPKEDGYSAGEVFPQGPWRPKEGVQRGSVADMPLYPGDPLTPGVGAIPGAKRLALSEAQTITKIPVLPISYGDAQPLLAALTGPVAPATWRGALPITYRVGPGPAKVHLRVRSNWDTKKLYDVIGKIQGSVYPDEWIIRGNHHDAWVNGAEDPVSGLVPLLEEARAFGELAKLGWKPKRTVLYCAWDGEEPGLLGSTEWVEQHAQELARNGVVYINSDTNSRGFLETGGSHTLEKFINDVAREVQDPETKLSVWKRKQLSEISAARTPEERAALRQRSDLPISALGSGSDFTPFLQHGGIASLNLGFGGESGGGIYHSIYDDFYWYTHYGDPTFVYGKALAQTAGTAIMRLADAELIPLSFTNLADTVQKYVRELEKLAKDKQDEIRERNLEIDEGVYTAIADPTRNVVAPAVEEIPPHLSFAALQNAAEAITRAAQNYDKALAKLREDGVPALADRSVQDVNRLLIESERKLTNTQGLPGRPWFKHQLYAPGFYTGYGVKTVPAVREAIEQKKWKEVDSDIAQVAQVLLEEAAVIEAAGKKLAAIR